MGSAAARAAARLVDWELVSRFKDAVQRVYPDAHVLLFGSRARGESGPDSNYDFLIISSAFGGVSPLWRGQGLDRQWAALNPPADMDLLCATPEEFERARTRRTSWISEADKEAIAV